MDLSRRLKRLERGASVEEPCATCGFVPGAPPEGFEVSWCDELDVAGGLEFCSECGQQTVYVVTWGEGGGS